MDENFRRLQYVRYADDFLIGIIGAKEDAQAVKQEIGTYIAGQLKLELSDEKTLVTKATDRAKFLGFEIRVTPQSNHTKKTKVVLRPEITAAMSCWKSQLPPFRRSCWNWEP